MSPRTFGGDYHKDTPKKYRSESFDDAHGNKLKMPFDSKHGSGFDLDWQYNDKVVRRVVAKRSLNPDHPLYHKLTSKVLEEDEQPVRIGRKHQIWTNRYGLLERPGLSSLLTKNCFCFKDRKFSKVFYYHLCMMFGGTRRKSTFAPISMWFRDVSCFPSCIFCAAMKPKRWTKRVKQRFY